MSVLAVAMGPAVTTAHDLAGGALGPFKISLILTGINGFLLFSWRRDSNKAPLACGDIGRLGSHAWAAVMGSGSGRRGSSNNKVALVVVTQGCFEAATFAFALLWTPLLRPTRDPKNDEPTPRVELPWGIVFSQQLVSRIKFVAMVVAVGVDAGYDGAVPTAPLWYTKKFSPQLLFRLMKATCCRPPPESKRFIRYFSFCPCSSGDRA